mgnify:CR=1 FL=1
MAYLTVNKLSEKWGISERRILKLCQDGRIQGAIKKGRIWNIPEDTIKPIDQRSKISSYVKAEKRVIVANLNTKIGYLLLPILQKQGFVVEGICREDSKWNEQALKQIRLFETDFENRTKLEKTLKQLGKYYDGLIFIDTEQTGDQFLKNKEWFIIQMVKKLDCESSVVLVNNRENASFALEKKLAKKSKQRIGFRINSLNLEIPNGNKIFVNYEEMAEDVNSLFTKFKNTTGMAISTDGGYIEFDEKGRTANLETGIFYRAIQQYFKKLNKESHLWCASTMLEDEWTEEPLEMNFRVLNLEAANRRVNMERIFIFRKSEIKKFKNNKTLKIYMQSNMKTWFVDYHEILEKEPKLLQIVGDGWDGIDEETLIVDLPSNCQERGYISQNKREVKKAYACFEELKKYAKDLKEVLK